MKLFRKEEVLVVAIRASLAMVFLAGGTVLASACSPIEDPDAFPKCEKCDQAGTSNVVCEINVKNQPQDEERVVCAEPDNPAHQDSQCSYLCANYLDEFGKECTGYKVKGKFQCLGTPDATGGQNWDPGAHVRFDTRLGVYEVDQVLVDQLKADASALSNDKAWLEETTGGFIFRDVYSGSLAYELGLRSGDIPVSLDGMRLDTFDAVLDAWAAAYSSTSFTLEVDRGGRITTLYYEII